MPKKPAFEDTPELTALAARLADLRKRASELGKAGADILMVRLKLMPLSAEMDYARASQEKKDYERIGRLLNDIGAELDDAERLLAEDIADGKKHEVPETPQEEGSAKTEAPPDKKKEENKQP